MIGKKAGERKAVLGFIGGNYARFHIFLAFFSYVITNIEEQGVMTMAKQGLINSMQSKQMVYAFYVTASEDAILTLGGPKRGGEVSS